MACRLFGAKPLPEPMLTYCQLDPYEQTSLKFESKYKTFAFELVIWCTMMRMGAFGSDSYTWYIVENAIKTVCYMQGIAVITRQI